MNRHRSGIFGIIVLLATVGCRTNPPVSQVPNPAPAEPQECFRIARASDIRMLVSTRKPGADGFPVAVIELWNNGNDQILFEYHPASLTLHVGAFEQRGPANLFARRREVLDPQEEIDFSMPAGGWINAPTTGPRDLIIPSELSPGKYPMWASFKLPGKDGQTVESQRDEYEVPIPSGASQPAPGESLRPAEAKDLRVVLAMRSNPSDGFPLATVSVYNTSNDQIIVGYEPECIALHCGEFEKHAPPISFVQRREILRPKQPLEFDVPAGGWMRSPASSGRELMIPTTLPSGKYHTWATFKMAVTDGKVIESQRDWFTVP